MAMGKIATYRNSQNNQALGEEEEEDRQRDWYLPHKVYHHSLQ
jgi:hypothetical protein